MPSFLQERAPKIAAAVASYGALRHFRLRDDAAKLLSLGAFGCTADKDDLEFVTPLVLCPTVLSVLRRSGSRDYSKELYAVSMGYIIYQWQHDHLSLPKNLSYFLDKNSGCSRERLSTMRRECKTHGWYSKEYSTTYSHGDFVMESIRRLMVNVGKLQLLTAMLRVARSGRLRVNLKREVVSWGRTVLFCCIVYITSIQWVKVYNRYIHHHNDSEEIERYRPSKAFQMAMWNLCAFLGIQAQSKSKQHMLAACILIQALITRMNRSNISIKAFLPVICYLFSQQ